jgi:hypothetical protein
MALPLLGLAGVAGRAALKKIAKSMAKKKAKKQAAPKAKKNPTGKDIKKAKDFKNSPEYDKAVKKLEQEMVAKTRKLGMTKKNPKASGEMFKTPKVSGGLTKKKPEPTGKYTKDGIPKRYMPGEKARSQELIKKLEKVESKPDNLQKFSGESKTRRLSDEFNVDDYRKGGRVKKTGARRGDGCAVKGKTRGRMV